MNEIPNIARTGILIDPVNPQPEVRKNAETARDWDYSDEATYLYRMANVFKNRFPSLKNNYDSLSVAIHLANPSDEVFLKVKEEIEHHFEGKKAFRITENEKNNSSSPGN
jgi:arabinogalactan endo-1,4-beta-galactosidase